MSSLSKEPDFLRYFVEQTNERFRSIDEKLADLTKFKVEMIVSARWVAMIVSSICGLLSIAVSVSVSFYLSRFERDALLKETRTTIQSTVKEIPHE
jgi:hypothetical protein